MKVLAVVSQKGGVGKTSVSLNLAFALARLGWRTLLVDADPQGGIGLSLNRRDSGAGLAALVSGTASLDEAVLHTRSPDFDLLPIGAIAVQDTHGFGSRLMDGRALEAIAATAAPRYDLLVIDTPSGFGGVTMGALRAADFALTPLQAEPSALRSAPQLLEVLESLRQEGRRVRLAGALMTMLQVRNKDSLAVAQEVWSRFPQNLVLDTHVLRDPTFLEASTLGVPIGLMRRHPPAAAAVFDQIAQELEPRLELVKGGDDDGPLPLFA
jgi:chromosome partitioning protein